MGGVQDGLCCCKYQLVLSPGAWLVLLIHALYSKGKKIYFCPIENLDPASCLYWKVKYARNELCVHLRSSSPLCSWVDALGGFKLTKHRHAPACSAAETSLPQPEHGLRTHHTLLQSEFKDVL